jgi:DNA-directed RNA polymerase specialized sigma24 family protein
MLDGPLTAGDKLLLLFDDDPGRLLRCREKLIRRFALEFRDDAEDLADETLKRVLLVLEREENQITTSIEAFISGFATNIIHEARKQVSRRGIALDDLPAAKEPRSSSPEELLIACLEEEDLRLCWKQCLDELPRSDREMLIRYYDLELGKKLKAVREQMACSLSLTNAQLRKRTFNLRKELEACIKNCLARRNKIQKPS